MYNIEETSRPSRLARLLFLCGLYMALVVPWTLVGLMEWASPNVSSLGNMPVATIGMFVTLANSVYHLISLTVLVKVVKGRLDEDQLAKAVAYGFFVGLIIAFISFGYVDWMFD